MSKIRWSDKDYKQIRYTLSVFNRKLNKLKAGGWEGNIEKMTREKIISQVETRGDFKKMIKSLKRFNKKGAEKLTYNDNGVAFSEWEINEAKRKIRTINKRRKKERERIEKLDQKSLGENTGNKMLNVMGDEYRKSLRDKQFNIDNIRSAKELKDYFNVLERQFAENYDSKSKEKLKENYVKSLEINGFPQELIDYFKKNISADKYYNVFLVDDFAQISYNYEETSFNDQIDAITELWYKYGS